MQLVPGMKAMVTGAASGIGRSIALALAGEGVDLCLIDIDEVKLAATAREVAGRGVEVVSVVCDLSRPAEISAAVSSLLSKWGRLNILVNNAGLAYYGPTHDMTSEQWNRIMSVNLMAPIQLVRELLPTLTAHEEAHILNICSIFGLVTTRKAAVYQTSKFALVGLTCALRAEYARPGFGVTALCPGLVRTTMIDNLVAGRPDRHPRKLPAWISTSPENVAAKAIVAIRKNKGLINVTPLARALWWLARLSPNFVDWLSREGWRR